MKKKNRRVIKLYLDSAATGHMVNDETLLVNVKNIFEEKIRSAKRGVILSSNQCGDINGILVHKNKETKCVLQDVLFMKDLSCNLLSIGKMEKAGLEISFKNGAAYISYKEKILYIVNRSGDTYQLELVIEDEQFAAMCAEDS